MAIVVAIDGPSGAGKSSTSRAIAQRAGWNYLDTGALYRGVAWLALEKNVESAQDILKELGRAPLRFVANPISPSIFVGNTDVTEHIRSDEVTNSVDIGTVVYPKAPLKIYLTADLDARADRREKELPVDRDVAEVAQSLSDRDHTDSTRAVSPLALAADAVEVDSTLLSLEETVERVWEILKERSLLGLPIIAILGRPNVGKSTLINRFIGRREAIVEDTPGVTRDRVQYECEWGGRRFIMTFWSKNYAKQRSQQFLLQIK